MTRTELRREVRALLRGMNVPALFITHDQEEALELADRIAVLNQERIEQLDTPFEIYNHPKNEFVATFLGAANVLLGRVREGRVAVGGLRLKLPESAPAFSDRQRLHQKRIRLAGAHLPGRRPGGQGGPGAGNRREVESPD